MTSYMNFHEDDRAQRLFDLFPQIPGQINVSFVRSTEHVTAWHRHEKQTDYWCCLKGSFKAGIVKLNNNEEDVAGVKWEYLSDKNFRVLEIPPGYWHGYKALEPNSIMLYYLTEKYDPNDEWKVKPGYFGETWQTKSQ